MKAKYAGGCPICKTSIVKGEEIVKIPPRKIRLPYRHGDGYFGPRYVTSSYAHQDCKEVMEHETDSIFINQT